MYGICRNNSCSYTSDRTGPNSFSSSSQNPSILNAPMADSGTYSVTVTVNGCTGSAGTTVVVIHQIGRGRIVFLLHHKIQVFLMHQWRTAEPIRLPLL